MHKQIPEIEIQITYNGLEVKPENDGYIGESFSFLPRTNLELTITCPATGFGAYQTKYKTTELEKIKPSEKSENKITFKRSFALLVDMKNEGSGYLFPRMRHNNSNALRLVRFKDGKFVIYEIGFCAQDEKLFFQCQLTREGKATPDNFLEKIIVETDPDTSGDDNIPENVALCVWFNKLSGVGCFKTKHRTIRLHWTELRENSRFVGIETGQWVVFLETQNPMLTTAFEKEICKGALIFDNMPSAEIIQSALNTLSDLMTEKRAKKTASSLLYDLLKGIQQ